MATHQGSSIVLKTVFDTKTNSVLRTIFDKKYIYYQTIADYIPPLFVIVNYEQASFNRHKPNDCLPSVSVIETTLDKGQQDDDPRSSSPKTDQLIRDNIKFLHSLLILADCGYESCQVTFLRLETVGDLQRDFEKLYPLWNVGAGALVRLAFDSWPKRTRALRLMTFNASTNRDVYTVNYAANSSAVTIVDYLEPLFAHCVKLTKLNGHDTENLQRPSGSRKRQQAAAATAAAVTTDMFEINFCIIDEPTGVPRIAAEDKRALNFNDRESSFSAASTNASKRTSGSQRKRTAASDDHGVPTTTDTADNEFDTNSSIDKRRRLSTLVEKQRCMCGPLTVHDVRPYFSMLNARRLSQLSLDQLEEVPVLTVHCEKHFCRVTCCVVDRTDNRLSVMHVYYCWDQTVHELLTMFVETRNNDNKLRDDSTMVTVSRLCSEDIEARTKMLEDLRNVIWKENTNVYVRLSISEEHDQDMLLRNFFEPLVFRVQRSTADMETEIKCSVESSHASGANEMFRNSVSLDCSRLCSDLDPKTCGFSKTYHRLLCDTMSTCNGFVHLDEQTLGGSVDLRQTAFRQLEHRQNISARLVSYFRSERILQIAFEMAGELRLGLLDLFGLRYTDTFASEKHRPSKNPPEDPIFDSTRVSNFVFIATLVDTSMYFGGTCGSVSAYNGFFAKERGDSKPLSQSVRGLYNSDMVEFDLQSAYPTIAALWNVSPETTAIVERQALKRLDEQLEDFVCRNSTCPRQSQLNHVMACIYNQIGHVNDLDGNLVIVSLRPEIYVGCLGRLMEKLVLKRNSRNILLNTFYKKLANVIYGCTAKSNTTPFNDLYSPQCASAIRSLCKSVMSRTLQNVPQENVLLVQTDGALLHTGFQDGERLTCKELETIVQSSIDAVFSDLGIVTTPIRLVARMRRVNLCLLIDQNRYLMMYADGKTTAKGQDRSSSVDLYTSRGGVRIVDTLLEVVAKYIRNNSSDSQRSMSLVINDLLDWSFNHLETITNGQHVEWFVTMRVPTIQEMLYNNTNRACLGGRLTNYNRDICEKRLADVSISRFGDTVAVWPVLVRSNEEVFEEFRVSRPSYNTALRPHYIFVVRNFLQYWVKWWFVVRDESTDEKAVMRMVYAISKKFERDIDTC